MAKGESLSGTVRDWIRFKGLASRIYVAFLLAAVIPTSVAGIVGIFYSLDTLKRETLHHLKQEAVGRAGAMTNFFEQLTSELRYLRASTSLTELAAAGSGPRERNQDLHARIERDFTAFARAYPYIYQVRYLNQAGKEVIRVDRRGEDVHVVPAVELQDKSGRYYVRDTLAVGPSDIYVSPLDLNIEYGQPEFPKRPVVRFGTPVVAGGAVRGILVINLHAGVILDHLRFMAEARAGKVFLFNRSRFYISRSSDAEAYSNFEMKPVDELASTFSRSLLRRILDGEAGTAEQGDWIIAFAPIKVNSLPSKQSPRSKEWAVVQAYPRSELFEAVFSLYILYGVLAVSLLVTAAAGFLLSGYLLRPLTLLSDETEEIARGNFSSRVVITGHDEIVGLGVRFNQMAEKLEASYDSLHRQKENLEIEVRARTAALERERMSLATVIQNTADGILYVKRSGEIELANAAATRLLDADVDDLVGEFVGSYWTGWENLAGEPVFHDPRLISYRSGDKTFSLNLAPVLRDDAIQGYIFVIRDVSEERRLQDERRELDRQIFQMEKMTAMGELAMGLAHEIGNPLAGMKAVVQALLEEMEEVDRTHTYLKRVENEIDRLSAFLHTFHGFSAPQEMHPAACELEEVLEDVLLWTREEANLKDIEVEYAPGAKDVPVLWADPNQLKQVILNLVMNAIHAIGSEGRIIISLDNAVAERNQPGTKPRAIFRVEDTGPGIPQDILPRIFDRFFTTRPNGTGLGLAMARKITEQHGADITAESSKWGGACFEVKWPIAEDAGRDADDPSMPLMRTA
jgi:signal transduction histidine kinase